MQHALEQAEQSVGLASPNPAVGCVLTQADRIVGQGFHAYDLRDHAEIVALRQAGSAAQGATAYVSLEPCAHQGRTGPCADALIAAGVTRVVAATLDPNPLVRGQGIARLRAAGIAVETGVLEQPARRLNESFARYITTSLPFVTMKVASSLDGRIAPASSRTAAPYSITGEAARSEVHRIRHASDAILVGAGTVLADDPQLTDRSGLPRRRPLLRVVLDSTLRTPLTAKLVAGAQQDVLIFFAQAKAEHQQAFRDRGVQLQQVSSAADLLELPQVLESLGKMQCTSLLLEGGAQVHTSALNQGLVDKLVLFYAPRFMGQQAVPMLGQLHSLPPLQRYELKQFAEDFALEAYLRDPWASVTPAVL